MQAVLSDRFLRRSGAERCFPKHVLQRRPSLSCRRQCRSNCHVPFALSTDVLAEALRPAKNGFEQQPQPNRASQQETTPFPGVPPRIALHSLEPSFLVSRSAAGSERATDERALLCVVASPPLSLEAVLRLTSHTKLKCFHAVYL